MIRDLVLRNRSYRRFDEKYPVEKGTLRELVDLARLSASAANMQPLRYVLACDSEKNALIFAHLAWAAYLKEWRGPAEGERPSAYIVILEDKQVTHPLRCDHGIAAQSILLGAAERDLGGCIIGAVKRESLRRALAIAERYEILLVIALGKPADKVVIEPVGPDGSIKYWRDGEGVHHVPKRALDDIIIG
jgi:nitroreductase